MSDKEYINIDTIPDIDVDKFEVTETIIDEEQQISDYLNKNKLTEKPETLTEKPETLTEKPETLTEKPETLTEKPETLTEKPETLTEKPNKSDIYDSLIYEKAMDTITSLMTGMKFNKSNWMILLNKITNIVRGVKGIKDNSIRVQLIYDLLMDYLDNYTDLSDNVIDFINNNAKYMCEFMLENENTNKKENNNKKVIKQYKLYSADTDAMINTLQISNLLVNKITVMIRTDTFKDFKSVQQKAPEVIRMCVKLVDKFKHLTKDEKQSLIAQAIEEVLKKEVLPKLKEDKTAYNTMELFIINLPMLISTITGIINGDIDFVKDIKPLLKRGWRKFKKIFTCCRK
jgi:hypothetical protein